jgi:diguanylate cyclase (GGDEF)-like protein
VGVLFCFVYNNCASFFSLLDFMTIEEFLTYNLAPIAGMVFQFIILLLGKSFTKLEKRVFILTLCLETVEIVSYNIEFALQSLDHPTTWRILFSMIGYMCRPALIYPFIYLLRRDTRFKDCPYFYLDLIPLALVVISQQFAFFTDWVFWFDEFNHWHSGTLRLNWLSYIACYLYLAETVFFIFATKMHNRKVSVALIVVLVAYAASAMAFETEFDIKSLGLTAAVFSIVFFIFSIQANHLNSATIELKRLSEVDSLSQLSNRYYGEKEIDRLVEQKKPGIFAIIDLDNFKHINDTYGHMTGDEAIVKVSQALKDGLAKDDVVMRLGGDEFAVYSLHALNAEEAKASINLLLDSLSSIKLSSDPNYKVEASVGIASYDGLTPSSFDELYKIADANLYEAKKHSGNYFCC